jgi:adenine phosphoribosyltransferase
MPTSQLVARLPLLRKSLRQAPIIRLKGYDYFVHPITDGIPRLDPKLLREVTDALVARLPKDCDVLLTPEAMGIPIASGVSLASGTPLTVARKRAYGLPGERIVAQRTGYGGATLHVHGIERGDRVVIIDDVVSTGGTVRALAHACRDANATLVKVLVVVNKHVDLDGLAQQTGAPIEALVKLRIEDGHVVLED